MSVSKQARARRRAAWLSVNEPQSTRDFDSRAVAAACARKEHALHTAHLPSRGYASTGRCILLRLLQTKFRASEMFSPARYHQLSAAPGNVAVTSPHGIPSSREEFQHRCVEDGCLQRRMTAKAERRPQRSKGFRFEKSSRFSASRGDERVSVPVCLYVMGLSLSSALHWRGGFSCRHAAAGVSLRLPARFCFFYLVFPAFAGCIT